MLRALAVAFAFLTRVPIALGATDPRDLGRAVAWFPAVGAALGAVLVSAHHILDGALATTVVALALVALHAVLSGGLHLDGVADVFDALGGGRGQRERMLQILRDPRIGAHGAVALVLLLVGKILAIAELLDRGVTWPLYAAPVAARWAVVPLVVAFPSARSDGLGNAFHVSSGLPQLVGATALAALAIGWLGTPAIAPALCSLLAALGLGLWLHRHLGGLTGDGHGAAIELAELAFFLIAGAR